MLYKISHRYITLTSASK